MVYSAIRFLLESALHAHAYAASSSVKISWQIVIIEVEVNEHDSVEVRPAHMGRHVIAINVVSSRARDIYIAVAIIIHIVVAVVHVT